MPGMIFTCVPRSCYVFSAHAHIHTQPRIQELLEKKWNKFAAGIFMQRFILYSISLLVFTLTTIGA